jgi:hypothetical protein
VTTYFSYRTYRKGSKLSSSVLGSELSSDEQEVKETRDAREIADGLTLNSNDITFEFTYYLRDNVAK